MMVKRKKIHRSEVLDPMLLQAFCTVSAGAVSAVVMMALNAFKTNRKNNVHDCQMLDAVKLQYTINQRLHMIHAVGVSLLTFSSVLPPVSGSHIALMLRSVN